MNYGANVTLPCFNFSFAFPWYQWEQMCYQLHWAQTDSGCIWQEFGGNLHGRTVSALIATNFQHRGFLNPLDVKNQHKWVIFRQSAFLWRTSEATKARAVCSIYNSADTTSTSAFGHFHCVCRAVTKMLCLGRAKEAVQSPPKLLNFSS